MRWREIIGEENVMQNQAIEKSDDETPDLVIQQGKKMLEKLNAYLVQNDESIKNDVQKAYKTIGEE